MIDERQLYDRYMLSVQEAMLGKITPNIRAVVVGWEDEILIKIKIILDREPTDLDREILIEIGGEVVAGLNWSTINIDEKIECSAVHRNDMCAGGYKALAYHRLEDGSF